LGTVSYWLQTKIIFYFFIFVHFRHYEVSLRLFSSLGKLLYCHLFQRFIKFESASFVLFGNHLIVSFELYVPYLIAKLPSMCFSIKNIYTNKLPKLIMTHLQINSENSPHETSSTWSKSMIPRSFRYMRPIHCQYAREYCEAKVCQVYRTNEHKYSFHSLHPIELGDENYNDLSPSIHVEKCDAATKAFLRNPWLESSFKSLLLYTSSLTTKEASLLFRNKVPNIDTHGKWMILIRYAYWKERNFARLSPHSLYLNNVLPLNLPQVKSAIPFIKESEKNLNDNSDEGEPLGIKLINSKYKKFLHNNPVNNCPTKFQNCEAYQNNIHRKIMANQYNHFMYKTLALGQDVTTDWSNNISNNTPQYRWLEKRKKSWKDLRFLMHVSLYIWRL